MTSSFTAVCIVGCLVAFIQTASVADDEIQLHRPLNNLDELAPTSTVGIIDGEHDALQSRFDLIQQAQHSVDLMYYAVDTDEVPIAILELLRQAVQRGVKVRLLVDGLKSRLPSDFEQYLIRCGIQIRVFHPLSSCHPEWINRRLHSKMTISDSQTAIIGSRNLENEYYAFSSCSNVSDSRITSRKFDDCDAIVTGEVATHGQRYFDWLWSHPDVRSPPRRDSLGLDVLNYRPYGKSQWSKRWREADDAERFASLCPKRFAK